MCVRLCVRLCVCNRVGQNQIYTCDRIFGDFPAKNTVYTPCMYGSGQNPSFWQRRFMDLSTKGTFFS